MDARDSRIGGYPILTPKLDVTAIGAGGGSIAWRDRGGAFNVGPRSAGADAGPRVLRPRRHRSDGHRRARRPRPHRPRPVPRRAPAARPGRRPRRGAAHRRRVRARHGGRRAGDPRDRQREHGPRGAHPLRAPRLRPARVRARRLRRRRPAARVRGRRAARGAGHPPAARARHHLGDGPPGHRPEVRQRPHRRRHAGRGRPRRARRGRSRRWSATCARASAAGDEPVLHREAACRYAGQGYELAVDCDDPRRGLARAARHELPRPAPPGVRLRLPRRPGRDHQPARHRDRRDPHPAAHLGPGGRRRPGGRGDRHPHRRVRRRRRARGARRAHLRPRAPARRGRAAQPRRSSTRWTRPS